MMKKYATAALGVAALALGMFTPAHAATDPGQLGTVSFSATGTSLDSAGVAALNRMAADLKATSALRVEAYGGSTSVAASKASSRAGSRGAAVKAWLQSKKLGGTITVVNKGRWSGSAGSDKGNRVVLVATAKSVTFSVTSDVEGPDSSACNYTPSATKATVGTTTINGTVKKASGCKWTATVSGLPVGKTAKVWVNAICNDSGNGTPADDVCAYSMISKPWGNGVGVSDPNSVAVGANLTGIAVSARTASLATLAFTMVP